MNLPEFEHLTPTSLEEACVLLSTYGPDAKVLAGGTDLLVKMKHRRVIPRYVVNIRRIPDIDYVRCNEGEGLQIGALATVEDVKALPEVCRRYPILHQAASYMSTVEIRNRATLIGNICNGSPSAETAPALIALGANARVVRTGGERIVPVEHFFAGPGRTVLQPDELVTELQIPEPPASSGGAYEKHSLRRMDVAVVGVGVFLTLNGSACRDIRIVLSAVGPTPMRALKAEELLRGRVLGEALIDEAACAAADESRPRTGLHGTAEYKRQIVGVLTRQVIRQALRESYQ